MPIVIKADKGSLVTPTEADKNLASRWDIITRMINTKAFASSNPDGNTVEIRTNFSKMADYGTWRCAFTFPIIGTGNSNFRGIELDLITSTGDGTFAYRDLQFRGQAMGSNNTNSNLTHTKLPSQNATYSMRASKSTNSSRTICDATLTGHVFLGNTTYNSRGGGRYEVSYQQGGNNTNNMPVMEHGSMRTTNSFGSSQSGLTTRAVGLRIIYSPNLSGGTVGYGGFHIFWMGMRTGNN